MEVDGSILKFGQKVVGSFILAVSHIKSDNVIDIAIVMQISPNDPIPTN